MGTIDELGSQEKVKSASKFSFNHYIGLRVIWRFNDRDPKQSLPPKLLNQVKDYNIDLAIIPGWDAFLHEIKLSGKANFRDTAHAQDMISEDLGQFANVCQYQRHVVCE